MTLQAFYSDPMATIYQGHVMDVLAAMPEESVDCVITSPPYWGLRRYSGEQSVPWPDGSGEPYGLEKTIEAYLSHTQYVLRAIRRVMTNHAVCFINLGDSYASNGITGGGSPVDLRMDGRPTRETDKVRGCEAEYRNARDNGLKPLDMCLMPERVALMAQADAWFVRSVIIWNKPNPMPESISGWTWTKHRVKIAKSKRAESPVLHGGRESLPGDERGRSDISPNWLAEYQDCPGCPKCAPNDGLVLRRGSWRPTSAYEEIIMLAKTADYFADGEGVREAHSRDWTNTGGSWRHPVESGQHGISGYEHSGHEPVPNPSGRNLRDVWTFPTQGFTGDVSYGTCRIASLSCRVHGYQVAQQLVPRCDELLGASLPDRNPDSGSHPVAMQEGAAYAIPLCLGALPSDEISAIGHSSQSRKMEVGSRPCVIFVDIPDGHIEYRKLLRHSVARFFRKHGNKTEEDVSQDEMVTDPWGQTLYYTVGILTFAPPNHDGCTCYYTGRIEKRQDHFAVFPEEIPKRCILAGTSEGGYCCECGMPWARVVDSASGGTTGHSWHDHSDDLGKGNAKRQTGNEFETYQPGKTLGFRPTCTCGASSRRGVVLDPFAGSGTTLAVAKTLGRQSIGIELSPDYCRLAVKRLESVPLPMVLP